MHVCVCVCMRVCVCVCMCADPACHFNHNLPILLPGGAVKPAMKAATGLESGPYIIIIIIIIYFQKQCTDNSPKRQ